MTEELDTTETQSAGISRRKMIGTAAAVGTAAWVAPSVLRIDKASALGSASPTTFSLVGDYDKTTNGGPGKFLYLQRLGTDTPLVVSTLPTFSPPLDSFAGNQDTNPDSSFPFITKNDTGSPSSHPAGFTFQPGNVYAHPGNGAKLVVQLTVPNGGSSNGTIAVLVDAIHNGSVDAEVTVNGVTLSGVQVVNAGSGGYTATFTGVDLSGGAVVELILGPNGFYGGDSTRLALDVTA